MTQLYTIYKLFILSSQQKQVSISQLGRMKHPGLKLKVKPEMGRDLSCHLMCEVCDLTDAKNPDCQGSNLPSPDCQSDSLSTRPQTPLRRGC